MAIAGLGLAIIALEESFVAGKLLGVSGEIDDTDEKDDDDNAEPEFEE